MENKQKKGISLIVLVITIIVMIILAAAIILSLNGSGIIGKANEAKTSSDLANAKYVVTLAKAEWDLMSKSEQKNIIGGFKAYAEDKLGEAGYKTGPGKNSYAVTQGGQVMNSGKNTMYVGEDNRPAIIPVGFTVSTNTSEDTVTEGLVIKDSYGNEFVWVPVDNIVDFITEDGYTIGNLLQTWVKDGRAVEPYKTDTYTEEETEYLAMRESVRANGGFYIGRYEAGTTTERKEDTDNKTTELVVQKNKFVYNFVVWGPSMTDTTGEVTDQNEKNQGLGAVELSRNMYKSSTSVVSTLCYSVQWDAALRFIATNEEYIDYLEDSTGRGNYGSDVPIKTGSSEDYATNNIYDMAGNVEEWTMEAYSTNHRDVRGGFYNSSGSDDPASTRDHSDPDYAHGVYGFRVTLYIK